MELYHLHLKGNYDRMYKKNSEFIIDKNKFNNRLYNQIYNMNATVDASRYQQMIEQFNCYLSNAGLPQLPNKVNLGEFLGFALLYGASNKEWINMLTDAKKIILAEGMNIREMAMEEYRKENCDNIPSRLHSLYACSEEGIDFWKTKIRDNDVDVYRIDVLDEPFVSNEILLPAESLCYGDKKKASYKYFNPKKKDLNPATNEYLVQGKVKILEKVTEFKNK